MTRYLQPLALIAGLACLSLSACGGSGEGKIAYLGASIWDGTGTPPILDAVLLVADGQIEAIGTEDEVRVPRGAQELRVDGRWIIPGLIDSHAHATNWAMTRFLTYGVTSVRGMGGDQTAVVALRDSVLVGALAGPRLFISGSMIDGSPATFSDATQAN